MAKGLLFFIAALVCIAAAYFVALGIVHLIRSLLRQDDLDEAAELRRERQLIERSVSDLEAAIEKAEKTGMKS